MPFMLAPLTWANQPDTPEASWCWADWSCQVMTLPLPSSVKPASASSSRVRPAMPDGPAACTAAASSAVAAATASRRIRAFERIDMAVTPDD